MTNWEEHSVIDITSAFVGITTPLPDIISRIQELGWQINNIAFKNNSFVASANSAYGEKLEATGNTEATAAGNLLTSIQRQNAMHMPYNARVAAWNDSFVELTEEIAHEYAGAKMYDKKAAGAWTELADDCRRRVDVIRQQIVIETTNNPIPYKSFSEMAEDVQKGHFTVSRANASHPIWSTNQVVDFRIAHDILGHVASGGDWSWFGINRAFQAHAPLLSYTAQKALFTEVLAQGAFNSYYGSIAPQKIAFLEIFDSPEGGKDPYHHPVHPSQTIIPGAMAKIPVNENFKEASSVDDLLDPNDGYNTGVEPLEDNAYNWHRIQNSNGQMVDPLHSQELHDIVRGIKSDWHKQDEALREQAVANAFRNVLLKPGKHERAHAQHYQSINHLPGPVSDPSTYWDVITSARDEHNAARGYMQANKETEPFHMPLKRQIQSMNPDLNHDEIGGLANDMLLNMRAEEEREAKKRLGSDASAEDIHKEATKRFIKRLKRMTNAKVSQDYDFGNEKMFFESKHPDPSMYPSPLAHHVKPISDISKNIKDITNSAVEDIKNGGKGHHFRSSLMKRYFEDLEPHQIDEAWFYLAPETTQLGAVTPDVLKALGRKKDDLSLRDYFKAERELQAARDASGYGHMPLGQFSKGLKNAMRQVPGHHPTKTHLNPVKPTHHTNVDWSTRQPKAEKPKVPGWFNNTKDARKQVGKDWDRAEGIKHPKGAIPFKKKAGAFSTILTPFYSDPNTSQQINGQPGQSLMQHMTESMVLSTPEVWAMNPAVGKEAVQNDINNSN